MGKTIYTQKMTHPVRVSFTCEHCGEFNYFTQDIVATSSAEVSFGSSARYTQNKVAKIGPAAQNELERKVSKARLDVSKGKFSWLKHKKCSKCKYHQSWQTSSIWLTFIGTILWYILPVLLISVWFDFDKMNAAGWIFFVVFIGVILIPFVILIVSLTRMDRKNKNIPTVDF